MCTKQPKRMELIMWLNKGDRVKVYDDSGTWEVFGRIESVLTGCELCDDPRCENADEIHHVIGLAPGSDFEFTNYDMKYHGYKVIKFTN